MFIHTQPNPARPKTDLIFKVEILALQGRQREALDVLHDTVNKGWRGGWQYVLLYEPNLASIRDLDEFQDILNEVNEDMAVQLERVHRIEFDDELASVSGLDFKSK